MSAVTRSASASPSVSLHSAIDPSWFPLKSIADVVQFFRRALETSDPDLTLLSIVAGYVELSLTTGDAAQAAAAAVAAASAIDHVTIATPTSLLGNNAYHTATNTDIIRGNGVPFPLVTHETIAGLYKKFQSILSVVDKPKSHGRAATRDIIKKVSDVIWHSLIRSTYKDRAHLQNLYSYLSGNKLDSFGVALAVVAGCQLLGYRDVRLAISEDHAWVVFGSHKRPETIEVTWHGKGSEDKRGHDISIGIESRSWLYLCGQAVVCDRHMEVAAIASAINISLSSSSDCVEVADLQQQLLWLLYDLGHLQKYPMALGSLGELEEINPTRSNINCEQLYAESISASRKFYRNHHVYPYTYQGNYYNRMIKYREAFAAWANAGDVIRLYTYQCRDDEEIYKELLDIANEMIPYVMKTESSGHSGRSILRDSEVFANLLRFYDGICQWEEDSLTPILHIGWAKPLVNNITKFDYDIRSQVVIKVPEDEAFGYNNEWGSKDRKDFIHNLVNADNHNYNNNNNNSNNNNNNNNSTLHKEEKIELKKKEIPTTLADLTAACGEKILNPEFLLQGGSQPFAEQKQQVQQPEDQSEQSEKDKQPKEENNKDVGNNHQEHKQENIINNNNNNNINNNNINNHNTKNVSKSNGSEKQPDKMKPVTNEECKKEVTSPTTKIEDEESEKKILLSITKHEKDNSDVKANKTSDAGAAADDDDPRAFILKRPIITLYSQKMKGLKDLLLAEKLNTHAISLQVTAQSVPSRKVRGVDKLGHHTSNSTYASINLNAAAATTSHHYNHHHHHHDDVSTAAAHADSIAVSRPKRTRRE